MAFFDPSDIGLAVNGYCGVSKLLLRGRQPALTTSYRTIWQVAGAYARLSAATACEVVSSSANDTAAGTGARTVVVEGILSTGAVFTETVTLNGVTPVALTNTTAMAINRFYVATAGSGGKAAGTIDVRTVSGSVVKSEIVTTADVLGGGNSAADFVYTIPTGKIGVLKSIRYGATGVTGDLSLTLELTNTAGLTYNHSGDKSSLYVTAFNAAKGEINLGTGVVVPALWQIELRGLVSAGAGDLIAQGDLILIDTSASTYGAGPSFPN